VGTEWGKFLSGILKRFNVEMRRRNVEKRGRGEKGGCTLLLPSNGILCKKFSSPSAE